MDWYTLLKFLHIVSVIIWLGGALVMVILGNAANRSRDDQKLVDVVRQVAWCAERVFVPASLATLVFGAAATWIAGLWTELWVVLGLFGVAVTLALGIGVLSPMAKKVGHESAGATPEVIETSRDILAIAKFDMVLLFTIVAVMVLKPQAGDWAMFAIMAVVLVAAGLLFLHPIRRRPVAAS